MICGQVQFPSWSEFFFVPVSAISITWANAQMDYMEIKIALKTTLIYVNSTIIYNYVMTKVYNSQNKAMY